MEIGFSVPRVQFDRTIQVGKFVAIVSQGSVDLAASDIRGDMARTEGNSFIEAVKRCEKVLLLETGESQIVPNHSGVLRIEPQCGFQLLACPPLTLFEVDSSQIVM